MFKNRRFKHANPVQMTVRKENRMIAMLTGRAFFVLIFLQHFIFQFKCQMLFYPTQLFENLAQVVVLSLQRRKMSSVPFCPIECKYAISVS